MLVPSQRRASSLANRMLACLDCPACGQNRNFYTSVLLLGHRIAASSRRRML